MFSSGSGGTNNSTSSHENSSSSARFSSSSTLPSSTDITLDDRPQLKEPYRMPAPPIPENTGIASLKAAGRAFSFGRKKAEGSIPAPRPPTEQKQYDGHAHYARERAQTESSYASESTATPPKLLDTGLDFGSTDNFGSMFDSFGKNRSQTELSGEAFGFGQTESPGTISPTGKSFLGLAPSPLNIDHRSRDSPRSFISHGSQDGLMASSSLAMERTFSYEEGQERIEHHSRPTKSRTMPLPDSPSSPNQRKQQRRPSDGLQRRSVYASKRVSARDSTSYHDEDARLVMDSISASRRLDISSGVYHDSDEDDNPTASLVHRPQQTPSPHATTGAQQYSTFDNRRASPGPIFDGSNRDLSLNPWQQAESIDTTPRAKKRQSPTQEERSMFDASPPLPGRAAPSPRLRMQPPPKLQTQNKIMTPAQFERYRKEQEMNRTVSQQTNQDASDEEADDYEDDDEVERNKQLAKQRRKQEAHLAVYRQQMMKVTGEQPSDLPNINLRPNIERSSMSSPNLTNRASTIEINFDKATGDEKASDDEDEDVPLGVLAAHGFPSKNRPPTAMSARDSRIQYKSESYPPPPASTSGASQAGRAAGLPPFARNLPQDPYYGASLVNSSNRESLAFGNQSPGSTHGGTPQNMPPGGLVGVIAGEEQARAARRGSPNAHGSYGSPLPLGMNQMPGMPPGMPPILTPGEQATVQMSEQMNQMMQMQMQWMQQMQQMMTPGMQFPPGQHPSIIPGPQPMVTMSPMMAPPSTQPQRPMSSGPQPAPGTPGGYVQAGRTMSMMGPGPQASWPPQLGNNRQSIAPTMMSGGLGGPPVGYAPSIAPSERSNIGMPSRYRPVSIAPADEHKSRAQSRASTMNSGALHPDALGKDSRLSTSRDRKSNLSSRPVSRTPPQKAGSDDDDEEGWEAMKQKREQKKSVWRQNKKKDEQVNTGLEYYDYSEV